MKHRENSKSNFNYLKREPKEVNTKIDDLRQFLLDVSDILIAFYILLYKIMSCICVFMLSYCMVYM